MPPSDDSAVTRDAPSPLPWIEPSWVRRVSGPVTLLTSMPPSEELASTAPVRWRRVTCPSEVELVTEPVRSRSSTLPSLVRTVTGSPSGTTSRTCPPQPRPTLNPQDELTESRPPAWDVPTLGRSNDQEYDRVIRTDDAALDPRTSSDSKPRSTVTAVTPPKVALRCAVSRAIRLATESTP